ncbi:MAG TPA: hypothetical protein VEK15_30100 [Vicinamibacteria bacterium]|nr:hypothetical protein [Vicinamibacteria bacterium]
MRTAIGLALLTVSGPALAADPVIGLLSLPEVFGDFPCDEFTPEEITLYRAPDSNETVGWIRVETYWTFHAIGGCEGLKVSVYRPGTGGVAELPTKEYDYEAPAAIVLQEHGRWFQLLVDNGAAWIRASERDEFFPLERLLEDRLTYLTSAWDGRLAPSPGAETREAEREPHADESNGAEPNVRVLGFRRVGEELWVDVEVMSHSFCEGAEEPKVTASGWIPAHAASGELTIWFYSRGC